MMEAPLVTRSSTMRQVCMAFNVRMLKVRNGLHSVCIVCSGPNSS